MQRHLAYLHQKLDSHYPLEEIGSFSKLLLRKVAKMSSVQIYSDKDRTFPDETFEKLASIIDRLAKREPIQYILEEAEFYGLHFIVGPGVLIPRPETEELVDLILKDCLSKKKGVSILDIGTGSGCIAVSLAKSIPFSQVSAFDISHEALNYAIKNAVANTANVHFEITDILNFTPSNLQTASIDIIVSNPPYVRYGEASEMDANVLKHEPSIALFVENEDPMLFYRVISGLAIKMLKPDGALYFEINSYLGKETHKLVKTYPFREVALFQDISGKDRMIRAIL